MREFVYFSGSAVTSGKMLSPSFNGNLMKAGRMDIAVHSIIQAFFLSKSYREDVRMHLIFYGMPDPPKHIEILVTPELEISKKDVSGLIKKILYKFREGRKTEVLPKCFIERKSFLQSVEELLEDGKEIFVLDRKGEDIRKTEISKSPVFVVGDHEGLPKKEMKRLKKISRPVSVGSKTYFASQVITLINNEMDRREENGQRKI